MVLVTLFLSFSFLSLAFSDLLAVTIANQSSPHEVRTIFLPVVYSTLGEQRASTSIVDLTLVTHPSCHMPEVRGKVAVFVGGTVPMFTECNTAAQANIATFARVVQSYGAYALLVDSIHSAESGRVVGFSKTITMPVLVMPKDTKKMFQSPDLLFYNATLPVMHVEEANKIASLRASWDFLRIFTSILYALLFLVVLYLFIKDLLKLRMEKKVNISLVMRGIAVYCCVISLLYCTVDPLGFDAVLWWKNSFVLDLHFSSVVTVFSLLLLMWCNASLNRGIRTSYVICTACILVFIVSVVFGFCWHITIMNEIYSRSITSLFVLLAICFCIVGKSMLQILYRGRSLSGSKASLILKITIFIGWHFTICMVAAVVYSSGILGPIFEMMVTIMAEGLSLTGTFVVLFFKPFKLRHPVAKENPMKRSDGYTPSDKQLRDGEEGNHLQQRSGSDTEPTDSP